MYPVQKKRWRKRYPCPRGKGTFIEEGENMSMQLAIMGYGNLGHGVELAARQNPDMTLTGIYTSRPPETVRSVTGAPVYAAAEVYRHAAKIDVLVLCGGSAKDLPHMTPTYAGAFHVVDSFDTHAAIAEHFEKTDAAARAGDHLALISAGWDPGLLSLARMYAEAVLPAGKTYTFWGPGVSQGHSDAVRRIPGVRDAREYTLPQPEVFRLAQKGGTPPDTPAALHRRVCYVVPEPGADTGEIARAIRTMPDYFAGYQTEIVFLNEEKFRKEHTRLPHEGIVLRYGTTGCENENKSSFSCQLKLSSNPEFTGSVLVACARAVHRMRSRGCRGCITMADVAPADLSPLSSGRLRAAWL